MTNTVLPQIETFNRGLDLVEKSYGLQQDIFYTQACGMAASLWREAHAHHNDRDRTLIASMLHQVADQISPSAILNLEGFISILKTHNLRNIPVVEKYVMDNPKYNVNQGLLDWLHTYGKAVGFSDELALRNELFRKNLLTRREFEMAPNPPMRQGSPLAM